MGSSHSVVGAGFSNVSGGAKGLVKRVRSLGGRDDAGQTQGGHSCTLQDCPRHGARTQTLLCHEGHPMRARITREMFVFCEANEECEECGDAITTEDSSYVCRECHHFVCNHCAREMLGLATSSGPERSLHHEPLELMPGDLFFCGPDAWGIHHVIVARSGWLPIDPEVEELLMHDLGNPGVQILACRTMESTQGSVGDDTWWYPAITFFSRCPYTGAAHLIADLSHDEVGVAEEPVPMKILLHPFRPGNGLTQFNERAFEQALADGARTSKKYGKRTAVGSVIAGLTGGDVIEARNYRTEESRRNVLEQIRESWEAKPICAAVAVKTWQRYFDATSSNPDEVLDNILNYMPHWCTCTSPSSMVRKLTQSQWRLQNDLDS